MHHFENDILRPSGHKGSDQIDASKQPASKPTTWPIMPRSLKERLKQMGAHIIGVSIEGHVVTQPGDKLSPHLLKTIRHAHFSRFCQQHFQLIAQYQSPPIEVFLEAATHLPATEGLWLVSLPGIHRRLQAESPWYMVAVLVDERFPIPDPDPVKSQATHSPHRSGPIFATPENNDAPKGPMTRDAIQAIAPTIGWIYQDAFELDRRHQELAMMSTQLGESYEELSLVYKLSSNMAVDQPPETFLNFACDELREVLGLRWLILVLADKGMQLKSLAGRVFQSGDMIGDLHGVIQIGRQAITSWQESMEHISPPPDVRQAIFHSAQRLRLPPREDQYLGVWLARDDKPVGILIGGEKLDQKVISSIDLQLCHSLASSLAIFIENIHLYEDLQSMFVGTLRALTSSIDAKDTYTHGHSERVAIMSRYFAREIGLSNQDCERIYIAGLVHDVGKIGVPESILTKPGRLTEDEFDHIKKHPEIGAKILADIPQMQDVIDGVMYHHERWDGNGYPHNLAGNDIPILGRLICLADSYDAMSSIRTYRQPMSHEEVLGEIKRCSGSQFDPELATAFIEMNFGPIDEAFRKQNQNWSFIRQCA